MAGLPCWLPLAVSAAAAADGGECIGPGHVQDLEAALAAALRRAEAAEAELSPGGVAALVSLLLRVLAVAAVVAPLSVIWGYLRGLRAARSQSSVSQATAKFRAGELPLPDYTQVLRELHREQLTPVTRGPCEEASWLTDLVQDLWPHVGVYVEDLLVTWVQPLLRDSVSLVGKRVRFTRTSLGKDHPLMGPVRGRRLPEGGVELLVGCVYHSDCDITLDAGVCTIGCKGLNLSGTLSIVLRSPLPRLPFIGGLDIAFVNTPHIDMEWTGLGSLADAPMISGGVRNAISAAVASVFVLPNRIAIPFSWTDPAVIRAQLRCPLPVGVLRLIINRASGLAPRDVSRARVRLPSPHVSARLGARTVKTGVEPRTAEPEWQSDNVLELPVYSMEQWIELEVCDGGSTLGVASRLPVNAFVGKDGQAKSTTHTVTLQSRGEDKERLSTKGTLSFDAEFLELSEAEELKPTRRGAAAFLVAIRVDEVTGLSASSDGGAWTVKASAGGSECKSWEGWAQWVDGAELAERVNTARRLPGVLVPDDKIALAVRLDAACVSRLPTSQLDESPPEKWAQDAVAQRQAALQQQRPQFEHVMHLLATTDWEELEITLTQKGGRSAGGFRIPRAALRLSEEVPDSPRQRGVTTEVFTPRGSRRVGPECPTGRRFAGPFDIGTQGAKLHGCIEFFMLKPGAGTSYISAEAPVGAAARWVKDKDAKSCMACKAVFTLTRRRHHCRKCGIVVCDECSPGKMRIPGYSEKQRVCRRCERDRFRTQQVDGVGQPEQQIPALKIEVIQGRREIFSTFQATVTVKVDGDERSTQPAGSLNPQWKESFEFASLEPGSAVLVECAEAGCGAQQPMGSYRLDPAAFVVDTSVRNGRRRAERWVELTGEDPPRVLGTVHLAVELREDFEPPQQTRPRSRWNLGGRSPDRREPERGRSSSPRSPLGGSRDKDRDSGRYSPREREAGAADPMNQTVRSVDSVEMPRGSVSSRDPGATPVLTPGPLFDQLPDVLSESSVVPTLPPPPQPATTGRPRAPAMPPSLAASGSVQIELGIVSGQSLSGSTAKGRKFQCEVHAVGGSGAGRHTTQAVAEQAVADATPGGGDKAMVHWGESFKMRVQPSVTVRITVRCLRSGPVPKECAGSVEIKLRDYLTPGTPQTLRPDEPHVLPLPVVATQGGGQTTGGMLNLSLCLQKD